MVPDARNFKAAENHVKITHVILRNTLGFGMPEVFLGFLEILVHFKVCRLMLSRTTGWGVCKILESTKGSLVLFR